MKRLVFNMWLFILLIAIVITCIGFTAHSIAQKQVSTLSGRVVDVEGNPIVELPVFVRAVEMFGGRMRSSFFPIDYFNLQHVRTDLNGHFSITKIPVGAIYFGSLSEDIKTLIPDDLEANIKKYFEKKDVAALRASGIHELKSNDFEPDFEVLSLHSQGITFYPRSDFDQIVFAVKSGTHIDNVVVTVKPRMRIRGRVLFKDSTPVANVRLRLSFSYDTEDGKGHGSSGGSPKTDVNGYFVYYLDEKDDSAFYTFSVRYMGLIASADPVLLNPGERLDGLTFTFNSDPIIPKQPPPKPEVKPVKPNLQKSPEPPPRPKSDEVWIVNPANGHAYKRVHCKTRDDAIEQATKEKAHLVTINDTKEQEWLEKVFGYGFYWIGLSRAKKEGKWQWHNGEPLTYKNWLSNDYFSESFDANERDYAVITFINGKWYAVSPKSVIVQMTEMAIIEKADVKIKQPTKK